MATLASHLPRATVFFLVLSSASAAAAQPASTTRDDEQFVVIRPAPDSLSGHLSLAPRFGYSWFYGSLEQGIPHDSLAGGGRCLGLDLSYGLSRYVAVRLGGEFTWLTPGSLPSTVASSQGTSKLVETGVEYHVVDGAAVDPWIALTLGMRFTHISYDSLDTGDSVSLDYSGPQWFRTSMGINWFATQLVGVGPYLSFDWGTYTRRPDQSVPRPMRFDNDHAAHYQLSLGLRMVFDPIR